MAIPSSLVFFFILTLLVIMFHLVEGQETCLKEFECGKLGKMSYPFTNKTSCGLFLVNCQEPIPRIEFWVEENSTEDWLNIVNYSQDQIQIEVPKSCFAFRSPFLPKDEITFFTVASNLTPLLKCDPSSSDLDISRFLPNYGKYDGCEDEHQFTIYYNRSDDIISAYTGDLPLGCSTIQMALENRTLGPDNIFNSLAREISLEWKFSKPWNCNECFNRDDRCIGFRDNDNHNIYFCNKGKRNRLGLIVGSVIGGLVFILNCVIVFILWCQRKNIAHCWETKSIDYHNIENYLRNHGSGNAPTQFKYNDIKRITSSFKDKLGQGGFGSVFKGYLGDKTPVAVKLLSTSKGSGEEFINEVASISNTSHVNVVKLLGFCFEYNKRALVYEYMPNGSLEKYIFSGKSTDNHQLGWPRLFKIAVGIARGLEYLHLFCATRMVHFDIKPHNVLLDEDFCPKISDFGLAKLCSENKSMLSLSGARGTIGYIAPEVVFRNFGCVSHKSDVYSYGMMILEMVGGRKNSDIECNDSSQMYFPHWIYAQLERNQEIVLPSIMNDAEKESARKMIIVSLWCIQIDPSHRPTMSRVVEMLQGDLDILQLPPRPYLFSSANSCVADSSSLQ